MGFYQRWILPPMLDLVMRQDQMAQYRRSVVPAARGRVLEIGVGSGLNLPLYGSDIAEIIGLDPSAELLAMARKRAAQIQAPVELLQGSAGAIPLDAESVDAVVMTWTLCSIPDPLGALKEIRRVLKPAGALLFVEHGLSPDPRTARWQHRLTPAWRRIAGGCHLNRKVDDLMAAAGLAVVALETGHAQGPRPMTYMYEGRARRAG